MPSATGILLGMLLFSTHGPRSIDIQRDFELKIRCNHQEEEICLFTGAGDTLFAELLNKQNDTSGIVVITCSYIDNFVWRSNSIYLAPKPCDANFPDLRLAPPKGLISLAFDLGMDQRARAGDHDTIQLGAYTEIEFDSTGSRPRDSSQILWSQKLAIKIIQDGDQASKDKASPSEERKPRTLIIATILALALLGLLLFKWSKRNRRQEP